MIFRFLKKKKNFWQKLKEEKKDGFFALAPMADVTDNPFRKIITEKAKPDLLWTEFASCDGLSDKRGRPKITKKILNYEQNQRPIIAQIFGGKARNYKTAARICRKKGFDGIDINMGCPQKNILKQNSGSGLIRDFVLAKNIFLETKKGAGDIPVSVKTRLGFNEINLDWIKEVLSWKPACFTIHLRTKKEMSKVPAHWELMDEIVSLRDKISPQTLVVGNGDINSLKEAKEKIKKHKIDGVMIGRGIFYNPFLFDEKKAFEYENTFSPEEKIKLALKHAEYFIEEFPKNEEGKRLKNFALMKKFFKVYINAFDGAKDLRMELMTCDSYEEIKKVCERFLDKKIIFTKQ